MTVPPNTNVILNSEAIHTHPRYWGTADPLIWRPQRWILPSDTCSPTDFSSRSQPIPPHSDYADLPEPANNKFESESLYTPPPGTYIPWSGGARVCPGKRFGQVEFVAVMVSLFRYHRVEPVPRRGESMAEALTRTLDTVKDSAMVLLLQMNSPESVELKWIERF